MPPETMVEGSFIEQAKNITQRTQYQGFDLQTEDDDDMEEMADIEGIEGIFRNAITAKREKIFQRINNNTPEDSGQRFWGVNDRQDQTTRFHILYKDLSTIMQNASAMCPNCNALISKISFTANTTEYGTAYTSIEHGITDHEADDTTNDGGYEYTCFECDDSIDTSEIKYFIPENSLTLLKQFCNEMLAYNDGVTPRTQHITNEERNTLENQILFQTQRATQRARTTQETFPAGEQIQKDIKLHGPNGPQMRSNEKGIAVTSPEDFIFRNNGGWICKSCSNHNNGQSKICSECKEDKYTPTKNIKLTL